MSWKVYSLRTTTGEVGSRLDPVSGSWGIELNQVEDFSVTVKKSDLTKREHLWYAPWSGGVLFTYTDLSGREEPIVAGPITDYGKEDTDEIELQCSGIRKIFEYRTIERDLSYRNMTYGDIAWNLVLEGMDKPGGRLPIVHGLPAESGRYQRTYERWNLANNMVAKRLGEISNVINGPDMMFRPRWKNEEKTLIEWVFVHGTERDPLIPQSRVPDFDLTPARSDVSSPVINSSGADLRTRIWCTGSGEGEGIVRVKAQDLQGVEKGMPFLEAVMSDADQSKEDTLMTKAQGALVTAQKMVDQLTFSFWARTRKNPLGSFFVGDRGLVTLKGWMTIPDASREMTIIKMNGDLTDKVTIDFQEDSW